jgi:hypothetical protein
VAIEQKEWIDRGRCADVCGDRAFRRLRHIPAGNGDVSLGDTRAPWAWPRCRRRIQRSVWTGGRRIGRHGQQPVRVELHNIDISGSESHRQRGILHEIPEGDKLDLGELH